MTGSMVWTIRVSCTALLFALWSGQASAGTCPSGWYSTVLNRGCACPGDTAKEYRGWWNSFARCMPQPRIDPGGQTSCPLCFLPSPDCHYEGAVGCECGTLVCPLPACPAGTQRCPGGTTCIGTLDGTGCCRGTCREPPPGCTTDEWRCKPGTTGRRQRCVDGHWQDAGACPPRTPICEDGTCSGDKCPADEVRCGNGQCGRYCCTNGRPCDSPCRGAICP